MEWSNLRVLDFPDLQSFNTELHRITSQLRLCGEIVTDAELIDKTLSTFPPATAILSQQYRNMHFPRHAELMSYLFVAERQQQMLLKNAESRPAREVHVTESSPSVPPKSGSVPTPTPTPPAPAITPEVNSTEAAKRNPTSGRGRGRGRGRGGNSGEVDTLTTVAVRADTSILVIVIMITTTGITTTNALMTGPLTLVAIVRLESLRGPDPSQELVMNVVIPVITLGRVERPRMFAQCLDSFSE